MKQNIETLEKITEAVLLSLIILAIVIKIVLVVNIPINQDEFHYLSYVSKYNNNILHLKFQTFHVHFLSWITSTSINEVYQIVVARYIMMFFFIGSCLLTYLLGRQFFNKVGALFGVIAYTSFSFIVFNGSSFRPDSISSFLFLIAILLVIQKHKSSVTAIIAGAIIAFSFMISIKSLLYLLTIGIIFLFPIFAQRKIKPVITPMICFFISFIVFYLLLDGLHTSALSSQGFESATRNIGNSFSKTMSLNTTSLSLNILKLSFVQNPMTWILFLLGVLMLFTDIVNGKNREKAVLFSFLIPLTALIFYRNSYPYFYVFILSPAILFCGYVAHKATQDSKHKRVTLPYTLICTVSIVMSLTTPYYYIKFFPNKSIIQTELLDTVHRIFPEPVPYIDGCSMVSTFPSAMFFMSSLGMNRYLKANTPVMKHRIKHSAPIFLLVNVPHLNLNLPREHAQSARGQMLLKEDWEILKSNYIHHWGAIYVLGKKVHFDSDQSTQIFEPLVPGSYTIEGDSEIEINGIHYRPGDSIELDSQKYFVSAKTKPSAITIRWGDNLYKPTVEPTPGPIFLGPFL